MEIYPIFSIAFCAAFLIFFIYMVSLCNKMPEVVPDLATFDEKYNNVLRMIGGAEDLNKLLDVEVYAANLFMNERSPEHRFKKSLLAEHFYLRSMIIEGNVQQAKLAADSIEYKLKVHKQQQDENNRK